MSKKHRLMIILSFLILAFAVMGFGRKEIRLFYGEKKLIDLSAAIKSEPVGPEGNDDAVKKSEVSDNAAASVSESKVPEEDGLELKISVRGQDITMNDRQVNLDRLEAYISRNRSRIKSCKLIDDFADSETYEDVDRLLKDSGIEPEYEES